MSRLKSILFWAFLAGAIGLGLYAYLSLKNNKRPALNALSLIPDSCLVYVSCSDLSELDTRINERSLIADRLKQFVEVDQTSQLIQVFDSLINAHADLKKELEKSLLHFAYYERPSAWLMCFNIRQLGAQHSLSNQLSDVLQLKKRSETLRSFELLGNTYYLAINDGVVLLSNLETQIIKALNTGKASFENSKAYAEFKSSLNEGNLLNLFVNQSLYRNSKARQHLNLCPVFEKGCSAGAVEILPSQLKINGYASPDSSDLLAPLMTEEVQRSEDLMPLLPATTIWFKAYGFSRYETLRRWLPISTNEQEFWITKNQKALFNLEQEFYGNVVNHVLDMDLGVPGNLLSCVAVQDSVKSLEHLSIMADSVFLEGPVPVFELSQSPLLFAPYSEVSCHYAALLGEHLFFSGSYAELNEALNALRNGDLLTTNESFALYKKQYFSDDYNYLLYCSPEQFKGRSSHFHFTKNQSDKSFENFRHMSLSLSHEQKQFKFRFHLLNESEKRTRQQNVLWTLQLDTLCKTTAWPFVNHNNGENELVVQDENNVLYLINAKGTILWKKQLQEKIISHVYRVDIYKKNKYQLLFNGKKYLHLIDRNGNYVEKYPVKLPAEATNGLALFDYEQDKEYRLFVACADKTIYNFNIHGEKQDKFAPVKTDEEVHLPLQYIQVGASDYLVALDREGKIYTFSRKGLGRIGLRNRSLVNCSAFFCDVGNSVSNTRLVYVDDKNAMLNKISFDDKKDISKLVSDLENASVVFSAFDDNRSTDVLLAKDRAIYAFDFSGNLLFERSVPFDVKAVNFYSDESHSVVYALSTAEDQLILLDLQKQSSKILKANCMPLVTDLFNDKKKYLILTQENKLSCVLFN